MRLQRVYAESFCESLEGVVVDGEPLDDTGTSFDLDCEFTLLCDDGQTFKVQGWAVEITVLDESEEVQR